ncbi:MAG TPA: SDR family oxidoreductase [Jiangellaceae bacterium]
MSGLDGKRVVITGAARGIGARLAERAAEHGARVGLVGLEPDRLRERAAALGDRHVWAECDVTDQASLNAAFESVADRFGGVDVVVANAGISNHGTVATGPVDALVRTVEVNLSGVIRTASAALPHLLASRGYALLISSVSAFAAMPGMAAYAASKAGVEQFGNVLRLEVAHRGMAVGTAHPIWTDTDLVGDVGEDLPSFHRARERLPWPLRRVISVDECVDRLIAGIEQRRRRVYAPRAIVLSHALRTLTLSRAGERLARRLSGDGRFVDEFEAEVRALGRPFGRHHAGH